MESFKSLALAVMMIAAIVVPATMMLVAIIFQATPTDHGTTTTSVSVVSMSPVVISGQAGLVL